MLFLKVTHTAIKYGFKHFSFMETLYKCPWCGCSFENGKDLHLHAKEHYVKQAQKGRKPQRQESLLKFSY